MNDSEKFFLENQFKVVQAQSLAENIVITLATSEVIGKNYDVPFLTSEQNITVKNLFRGWIYVIDELQDIEFLEDIQKINAIVSPPLNPKPGIIRDGSETIKVRCGIGNEDYYPPIPDNYEVRQQLHDILQIANPLEKATSLFLFLAKSQLFNDGNKRTAFLASSKILLNNDLGFLIPPIDRLQEGQNKDYDEVKKLTNNYNDYVNNLINYYHDKIDKQTMINSLLENCYYSPHIETERDLTTMKLSPAKIEELSKDFNFGELTNKVNKNNKIKL